MCERKRRTVVMGVRRRNLVMFIRQTEREQDGLWCAVLLFETRNEVRVYKCPFILRFSNVGWAQAC
ncbi:hypothetical protein Hanom_Chr08g00731791 [Helianthus anomalus]